MLVIPEYQILFDRLRSIFPLELKPPFGSTDFIGEYGASSIPQMGADGRTYSANDGLNTPGSGNIEADPLRKIIGLRHLFVPHDQVYTPGGCSGGYGYNPPETFSDNGLPILGWFNLKTAPAAVDFTLSRVPQETGYDALLFTSSAGAVSFTMDGCAPLNMGFKAFFEISQPADAGTPNAPLYYAAARWRVSGSSHNPRWYSVAFQAGVGIVFGYCDRIDSSGDPLDAGWQVVDTIKQGEGISDVLIPKAGITQLPMLDVRLLAGQMTLSIGSEDTPYPWPHQAADSTGTHDWYIDAFQVAGIHVPQLQWEFHPTKFVTAAQYVSAETNVGYTPLDGQIAHTRYIAHTAPTYAAPVTRQVQPPPVNDLSGVTVQVGFLPPGTAAVATTYDINASLIRYQLALSATRTGTYKGQDYADFTPAVRAVSMDIPGAEADPPVSQIVVLGTPGQFPNPEQFTVTHTFDLGRLCITRNCSMTYNNYHGLFTNSGGTGLVDAKGHFAVQIGVGVAGYGALQTEFIGIANTQFTNNWQDGGNDKLTLFGEDLWLMLDVPCWNLPWFDGWNVYSVIAYLAGLGTLTRSQLDFAALVPNNPYDLSPGLADDQQYFMPIGPAGTPLTRFTGGQKLKDIMLKISQSLGMIMYFDSVSKLHFEKFQLPSISTPYRTFSHQDGNPLNAALPGLGGIWSGSYSGGLSDQRNTATVIGVNAFGATWNSVVAHAVDIDSVYNDSVSNYVGFFNPVVWVDNLFVDLTFAQAAADSILAYLRIPDRQIGFTTWYQPDGGVYPGDIIRVITPRSGAQGYTFFVTQTCVTVSKGQAPRCDIQARIIPQGS